MNVLLLFQSGMYDRAAEMSSVLFICLHNVLKQLHTPLFRPIIVTLVHRDCILTHVWLNEVIDDSAFIKLQFSGTFFSDTNSLLSFLMIANKVIGSLSFTTNLCPTA